MPDRLLSLVVLAGSWVPPAAAGWAAAGFAQRRTARSRPVLLYAGLAVFVTAWVAVWFLYNRAVMPPYISGASRDPTYAPPDVVRGLLVFASAVVLPASLIACALAFRARQRSLRRRAGAG